MIGLLLIFTGAALAQDAAGAVTVQAASSDTFGDYLTDGSGKSLYLFLSDTAATAGAPAQSACSDTCVTNWPPLTVTGEPTAGAGIEGSLLGTFARADGSKQVTYNGHPLYYFAKDASEGDTTGEGMGDMWYLVSPYGIAVKPAVTAAAGPAGTPGPAAAPAAAGAAAAPMQTQAEQMTAGEAVFNSHCAVCHGAMGQGGTGVKLAGNSVLGDSQLVISQILRGGRVMPPFASQLSDSDVAAVATYIRNSWGNSYGNVVEQQVTQDR
jgi:predicted lipoprotein with Yx(FWY)xxD motif/cytochrome c5